MQIQRGEMELDRIAEAPAVPRPARYPLDPPDRRAHRLRRLVPKVDHDRFEERGAARAGLGRRRRRSLWAFGTSDSLARHGAQRRPRSCRSRRWSSGGTAHAEAWRLGKPMALLGCARVLRSQGSSDARARATRSRCATTGATERRGPSACGGREGARTHPIRMPRLGGRDRASSDDTVFPRSTLLLELGQPRFDSRCDVVEDRPYAWRHSIRTSRHLLQGVL